MGKRLDLTGMQFGDLTVLRLYPKSDHNGRHWVCRCKCGTEIAVRANYLTSGHTTSCGKAGCRKRRKKKKVDYADLCDRLRNGTRLPMLQALCDEAADAIQELTAADVRPVVLCRDCKFWFNAPVADGFNSCELDALIRHENFFCASGEKREES